MPPVLVRKKYGYTASASKGSNRVIACSKANWEVVKDGSFIVLDKDDGFYKVLGKKKFIFQKEVLILNSTQLKFDGLAGAMIGLDDDIELMSEEYNVNSVSVDAAGEGYGVGDLLSLEGGVCKYNSIDQIDTPAQAVVKTVNASGGVLSIELSQAGIYSSAPESPSSTSSSSGSGATLNAATITADTVAIEGRTVIEVESDNDNTILHLNHPLPPRLVSGKIKVEKWELTLNSEYTGADKRSVPYEIIKDFTPFNNIPLIHGDLGSSHILYNEAMAIIDQRLKDLENKP
jgi:hypothetical protein